MQASNDTIAAICTACGGGVAAIRVSGSQALQVCSRFCFPKNSRSLSEVPPRRMEFCNFVYENRVLDEVLACFFNAPASFTGEDVVEIYCHGGELMPRFLLEKLCFGGARLAYAGEFTRRAFVNGKLDLTQAEAIGDIVSAKTDKALLAASSQLEGGLGREVRVIREKIIDISSHILAVIDFPDEGVEECSPQSVLSQLAEPRSKIAKLCESFKAGRIISKGINVVICGAPNVGKSSVFNALLGFSRAIVTGSEGTTRDLITESLSMDGHLVNFTDTAGIRLAQDEAEKIGVGLSYSSIDRADLLVIVLDVSRLLNDYESKLLESTLDANRIIVANKIDKEDVFSDFLKTDKVFADRHGFSEAVYLSATESDNIEALKDRIVSICDNGNLPESGNIVTNERQSMLLVRALGLIDRLAGELEGGLPLDLALDNLTEVSSLLGGVTGDEASSEVIDRIFSKFCVGK